MAVPFYISKESTMVWGLIIWIFLSIIVSVVILISSANHIKDGEFAAIIFFLGLGALITIGGWKYHVTQQSLNSCNQDVTFNPVWAGDQNVGYQLCHQDNGFWNWSDS